VGKKIRRSRGRKQNSKAGVQEKKRGNDTLTLDNEWRPEVIIDFIAGKGGKLFPP